MDIEMMEPEMLQDLKKLPGRTDLTDLCWDLQCTSASRVRLVLTCLRKHRPVLVGWLRGLGAHPSPHRDCVWVQQPGAIRTVLRHLGVTQGPLFEALNRYCLAWRGQHRVEVPPAQEQARLEATALIAELMGEEVPGSEFSPLEGPGFPPEAHPEE